MSDFAAATRSHYDVLAPTYNQFLSSFSQRVVPALDRLLLGQLPGGASVLDVCCGTGQLASELTKRGLLVTGVDLSAGMLSFARQNAPKAEFLQADVCTMTLPREFDAAVSTFDSLNHLPDRNSLAACFRNVASCLKPGGGFLFDLNMQTGFELRWWGRAQLA
ncbi:MAG: class I SAM-dependent methyltransferase, partial [Planctomycetes bacterium]|nr:class I SAM-dependent methyltransferase [Planctomycetota bacterium]